jgi:F-type H+-transporting ATPase subunit b
MLIDWFTVGAQALNFLILVWLMKHFLYQPVLSAIDGREKKIAAELADAAAKKAEAAKDREEFQKKNEAFNQQRAALLQKATDEARAERQRLFDEARKSADELSAKRQEKLRSDAASFGQTLARRTQQEVFSIARKVLADLATTGLEERMVAVFARRLGEMNGDAKNTLRSAIKGATAPAIVRSAFELSTDERAKVQNAINETLSVDAHLNFETAPDLVSGIELTANGQKISWSIADDLRSLEKGVGELLQQQDKPEARAEPKPVPKREAATDAKPASETPVERKPLGEAERVPDPGAKAKPENVAAPKAEAKLAPKAEATVSPEPEPAAAGQANPPSDAKTELKPLSEPVPNSETKTEPTTQKTAASSAIS